MCLGVHVCDWARVSCYQAVGVVAHLLALLSHRLVAVDATRCQPNRTKPDLQEVGLSAAALSSLVEAAVRLGLKAEEALRTVQATRQSLRVFLLWLLDTMQQHHAKEEPAPKGGGGGGFRHVPKHVRLLLAFLRRPPLPLGPGGQKPGNTEAIVGGTPISAYFKDAPLPQREDTVEVEKDEDEPDELAATSLRTQGHALRAAFEAVFRRPLDVLRHQLGPARLLRLPPSSAVPPALYTPPSMCPAVLCAAVCPECAILLVLDPSAQTAPVAVAIEPPPGRRWQQAALYGPVPLAPSQNEEALILLARGEKASGGAGSGRASAEVWRLPLAGLLAALAPLPPPPPVSSSSAADAGAAAAASWSLSPSLLLGAARLSMAEVEGAKGRELTQMAPKPLRLAVTGSRGVAAVSSHVNYLTLLDLEEDEEQEDAMEEED